MIIIKCSISGSKRKSLFGPNCNHISIAGGRPIMEADRALQQELDADSSSCNNVWGLVTGCYVRAPKDVDADRIKVLARQQSQHNLLRSRLQAKGLGRRVLPRQWKEFFDLYRELGADRDEMKTAVISNFASYGIVAALLMTISFAALLVVSPANFTPESNPGVFFAFIALQVTADERVRARHGVKLAQAL